MLISIATLFGIFLIFLIFFKITHIIWKTILFASILILLILGITGYLVYIDVQNTIVEEKLIIISNENEVLTGITFSSSLDEKQYLMMDQLTAFSEYLEVGDLDSILSDNHILIQLDLSDYNEINDTEYMNNTFTKEEIFEMILAKNPSEFLNSASKLSEEINLDQTITENEMIEYKMSISGLLFKDILMSPDKGIFDQINIYPERITIKLIKEMPIILNSIKKKISEVN
jgi:hypothetical protein